MHTPQALLNQTLQEAQILLQATHEYIKWQAPIDVEDMGPRNTFRVSCEAMRVTIRMTQVITWLMLQKSILSGEVTKEEVLSEAYRVLRGKTCTESHTEEDLTIPSRLRELLLESRIFYFRILRLDEAFRGEHPSLEEIRSKPLRTSE
jgi:regulator of CtrA degradation